MRRIHAIGLAAVTTFALLVGQGIASAQSASPTTAPDANAGMTKQVNLSPQEELQQGDSFLGRMESSRSNVRRMLETARAQRDVVKTLCLNDKLNQIDVSIRAGQERRQALEAAANRRDGDLSNHEFTILTVLRQRVEQLSAEANQCIGQEAGFIGESAVTAQIDPNLPQEDPSEYPVGTIVVQPPVCASCVQ